MVKKPTRQLAKKFGQILQAEKEKVLRQIEELKKADPFSDPDHASDNAAVDTDVREEVGHETISAQIRDMQRRLKYIDLALLKVAKGKYGYCEKCGKPIPLPRLELIPEARYCIEDERKLFA